LGVGFAAGLGVLRFVERGLGGAWTDLVAAGVSVAAFAGGLGFAAGFVVVLRGARRRGVAGAELVGGGVGVSLSLAIVSSQQK
jgi:hypothetical protein